MWGSFTHLGVVILCEDAAISETAANQSNSAPRRDVQRNRARLIEAARSLLADHPQVSMAAVSEAAGLGRNTIYRHFPTRNALLEAVRRESSDTVASGGNGDFDHVRPAGELANVSPTPMSVWDVLNKVAPFQLGVQIVAEAERLPGVTAAAIYLVDLDGRHLQRLAGPERFPEQIAIDLAVGPEIDSGAIPHLRATIQREMPGTTVAPLDLRGRATGVLLAVGAPPPGLRELAQEAAVALAIGERFTSFHGRVRRTKSMTPAAELQQSLLPPRIVRIGGAMLAANVLPSDQGHGDWVDYTDDPEQAWLGILDMQGKGLRSTAIAAAVLAAFRAARYREGASPATAIHLMHETLLALADHPPTASATIATWNSATALLHWVACGDSPPMITDDHGNVEVLGEHGQPRLGADGFPKQLRIQSRRLRPGQRVLLVSDGITARTNDEGTAFGIQGIAKALQHHTGRSAATTLRAIQDAALSYASGPLADDATLMVLAPNPQNA